MRILNILFFSLLFFSNIVFAEPIYHDKKYPEGKGPFPAVIYLHTSGGYKGIPPKLDYLIKSGYAIYGPNFFARHKLSSKNRFETWTTFRLPIEKELTEILELMKKDPKIDSKNIFATGYSNGGYWASYLAATKQVNAGVSNYGVWNFPGYNGYPLKYFNKDSNPVLALHGMKETVQTYERVKDKIMFAQKESPKVEVHYYPDAGHSWDWNSPKNKKDGYSQEVELDAQQRLLTFFKKNKK